MQSNRQHHMNNVRVLLFVLLIHFCPGGPLLQFVYRRRIKDEGVQRQTYLSLFVLVPSHLKSSPACL